MTEQEKKLVEAFIKKRGVTELPSSRPASGITEGSPPRKTPPKPKRNPFAKKVADVG